MKESRPLPRHMSMRGRGTRRRLIVLAFALASVVLTAPAGAVPSAPVATQGLGLPKTWDATFTGWERWSGGRPKLFMHISAEAHFVRTREDRFHAEYVTTGGSVTWVITLEHAHGDHDGANGRLGDCAGGVTITRPIAPGDGRLTVRPDDLHPVYEGQGYPRANPQRMVVPVSCVDTLTTGAMYGDTSSLQPQVWYQGVGRPTRYDRLEGKSRYGTPGRTEEEYHWLFESVADPTRVRVASLDFAAASPVVRDGMSAHAADGPIVQTIDEFHDGCGRDGIEWRDCRPALPDGASEKSWPFVVTGGEPLRIGEARFKVQGPERLTTATVTGTARLGGGGTLILRSSRVTRLDKQLVVRGLTSTTPLPRAARYLAPVTINWRVKTKKREYNAGTSSHTIYVAWREPLRARPESLLLTLVDLAARSANGASGEQAVFAGIWGAFEKRAIYRRSLDPATGWVTLDPKGLLQYWSTWSLEDELTESYSCPTSQKSSAIVNNGMGVCGAWADFLVDTLASQGIGSRREGLELPAAVAGPPGAKWMLVKNWSFTTPSESGDFPYRTDVYDCPSGITYGRREAVDAEGIAGQGAFNVRNPRGWFKIDDHAYAVYRGRIYDPSYGTGPFSDVDGWARASLDGFARDFRSSLLHNFEWCTAWLVEVHKGF